MELEVRSLAQRKLAKKSLIPTNEILNNKNIEVTPKEVAIPIKENEVPAAEIKEAVFQKIEPVIQDPPKERKVRGGPLNKETLIKMAKELGLDIREKKVWIKHSYTVTPNDKEEFKTRCEVMGVKMQDAMEEALHDWFKKTQKRYDASLQTRES